jgi:rubrerythrin
MQSREFNRQMVILEMVNNHYRKAQQAYRSPFDRHDAPEPALEIWRCVSCDVECAGQSETQKCATCEGLPEEQK